MVTGINLPNKEKFFCENYPSGKQDYHLHQRRRKVLDEIIYTNLCGSMQMPAAVEQNSFFYLKRNVQVSKQFIF